MLIQVDHFADYLEKTVERFLSKPRPEYKPLSQKRQQRLAKHEKSVKKCLDDTRALQHFVGAQQVAFHKILKKYKVRAAVGQTGNPSD